MFAVNTLTLHRGQFRDILVDSHADYVIWVRGPPWRSRRGSGSGTLRSGGDNNKS